MGSFAGHIDEAIVFLLLGYWWMYKVFPIHIMAKWQGKSIETPISFDSPFGCRGRTYRIPVEIGLKILFPVAGFLAEIFSGDTRFVDDSGHFQHLTNMQHMTIYGIFVLHGLIDLAQYYGLPIFKGADRLSVAMSLAWYGLSFKFHAHMPGKEGIEEMIHILPIYVIAITSAAVVVELWKTRSFLPVIVRIYGILNLGTWFFHASFILYKPSPFPGNQPNPNWDRQDMGNVHALVAIFGFHLILNMCAIIIFYITTVAVMKFKGMRDTREGFKPLIDCGEDEDEV